MRVRGAHACDAVVLPDHSIVAKSRGGPHRAAAKPNEPSAVTLVAASRMASVAHQHRQRVAVGQGLAQR